MKTNFRLALDGEGPVQLAVSFLVYGTLAGFLWVIPSVGAFVVAYMLLQPALSTARQDYLENRDQLIKRAKSAGQPLDDPVLVEGIKSWERAIALAHSKPIVAGLAAAFIAHAVIGGMTDELVYAKKYRELIALTSRDPQAGHSQLATLARKPLPRRPFLLFWAPQVTDDE